MEGSTPVVTGPDWLAKSRSDRCWRSRSCGGGGDGRWSRPPWCRRSERRSPSAGSVGCGGTVTVSGGVVAAPGPRPEASASRQRRGRGRVRLRRDVDLHGLAAVDLGLRRRALGGVMVGDVLDLGRATGEDRRGREPGCGLGADRGGRAACRRDGSATCCGATCSGCATNGGCARRAAAAPAPAAPAPAAPAPAAPAPATRGACTGARGACTGARAGRAATAGSGTGTRGRAAAATAEEPAELGEQRALEEEQRRRPGRSRPAPWCRNEAVSGTRGRGRSPSDGA